MAQRLDKILAGFAKSCTELERLISGNNSQATQNDNTISTLRAENSTIADENRRASEVLRNIKALTAAT